MLKINIDNLKKVCKNSNSMAQAAAQLGLHFNTFQKYAKKFNCYNPNQGLKGTIKLKGCEHDLNDVLKGKYPSYPTKRVKSRILSEGIKDYKCEKCNNSEWLGKKISLELHHIDGNRTNHKLENLKLLCPNCHSQTGTYRGKNKS